MDNLVTRHLDHLRHAGFDNRGHTVSLNLEAGAVTLVQIGRIGEVGIFLGRENMLGLRKRWHPAAVDERRVPADMVDMEMGM